jgi:hypothetical protein
MGHRGFELPCDERQRETKGHRMQRLHAVPSLAVVTAVAALVGCGSSDKKSPAAPKSTPVSGDQRGILTTVDALQTASRKGDGKTICEDIFTPKLVKSIEKAAKHSCTREVKQNLFAPDAKISVSRDIKVTGRRGTAVVREQNGNVSRLSLVKRTGKWRIDSVTPQKSG